MYANLNILECCRIIQRAVLYQQQAVDSTPAGHANLLGYLSNLGNSYVRQFEHTGKLQDIQHAIVYHQKAVDCTPAGHANLPSYLNNLGTSYMSQFTHTGMLQDIQHAILYQQQAVDSTPAGHANLPNYLNNLGNSYMSQYKNTGKLQNIQHAILYHQQAVDLIPTDHADLPHFLYSLGNSYSNLFFITYNPLDIKYSLHSYRQSFCTNGPPSIHLKSAKAAAQISVVLIDHTVLNIFLWPLLCCQKWQDLSKQFCSVMPNFKGHSDFVTSAVAVALDFARFDLALEWLENGRCLVWNQLNQLRTPIDRLKINYSQLADDFIMSAHSVSYMEIVLPHLCLFQ